MQKLAGVVILYNPSDDVYYNIMTYYPYLDKLYVLDNSEKINRRLIDKLEKLSKVLYICHKKNEGMAYSLNEALQLAKDKYPWLLTMDQDSSFKIGGFAEYKAFLDQIQSNERFNCVYGLTSLIFRPQKNDIVSGRFQKIESCITSGNIINVSIAIEVGGFEENLFIDEVDNEFCYRCSKKGFSLLRYNKYIMNHTLGNPLYKVILGHTYAFANHNYIRVYYIVRNRFYIIKKYPALKQKYYMILFKELCKLILWGPDKKRRLKYAIKGYLDYKHGIIGKIHS